jgi:hypothetical protein
MFTIFSLMNLTNYMFGKNKLQLSSIFVDQQCNSVTCMKITKTNDEMISLNLNPKQHETKEPR